MTACNHPRRTELTGVMPDDSTVPIVVEATCDADACDCEVRGLPDGYGIDAGAGADRVYLERIE